MKNAGQYDDEYSKCPCFWGSEPSKYAKLIPNYISSGNALDLGAGEGKNSFYLASLEFDVTAVEISFYAVRNFIDQMIKEEEKSKDISEKINIICADVKNIKKLTNQKFDVVIAYGLLHCFSSKKEIAKFIKDIKSITKKGGINVICTFTDGLPVPKIQEYLIPTLLGKEELKNKYYKDWKILNYEHGVIEHTHPTSKTMHQHSLCRMIAKKI